MSENYFYFEYLKHAPLIIQVVWIFIVVFLLIIIPLIIYLYDLRGSLRENEKIEDCEEKCEFYIINYLYAGDDNKYISTEQQTIVKKLDRYIANPHKRKVVLKTLTKLRSEIKGEIADSIEQLYSHSGLVDFAIARLKSDKWYLIAKGISELAHFQVKEVHEEVIKHIHHSRGEVRREVQLYLVNLFHFKGLDFLNLLEMPLSEWNQIQLLEALHRFDNQNIVNIKPWLKSTNDSVVLFALKLAKIYNQFETKNELLGLLQHENIKIRVDAICVLSYLQVIESKKVLKNSFNEQSPEEQIAFFNMIENVPEACDESFLKNHLNHENFEIKLLANKMMKVLNIDAFNVSKKETTDLEFVKIMNFIGSN
jgi:predicted ATPase